MAAACPIRTPEERQRDEALSAIEDACAAKVFRAIDEAEREAADVLRASGVDEAPSLRGYFTANLHQVLFCTLCGADPTTFAGGNAATAVAIVRNGRQIAERYWGADFSSRPPP